MRQMTMTINWGATNEPKTKCFQVQRHAPCQSLGLHKILVPYALPILLPLTALFRFPTRSVIQQLGLVEQLPQPRRILLVGLNHLKDQPPVLALADEEYPPWLWRRR